MKSLVNSLKMVTLASFKWYLYYLPLPLLRTLITCARRHLMIISAVVLVKSIMLNSPNSQLGDSRMGTVIPQHYSLHPTVKFMTCLLNWLKIIIYCWFFKSKHKNTKHCRGLAPNEASEHQYFAHSRYHSCRLPVSLVLLISKLLGNWL